MDCDACKKQRAEESGAVPRWTHEADMARMERTVKKLWVLLIITLALLFGTNAGWIYYESQWEEVTTTETYEARTDGGGTAIANGSGEVIYGAG